MVKETLLGKQEAYLRIWGAIVEYHGLTDDDLENPEYIWVIGIINEMVSNCLTKGNLVGGNGDGAKHVVVLFDRSERRFVVEDDYVHDNPQETLATIEEIKQSGRPGSTKPTFKLGPDWEGGGLGLFSSVRRLAEHGGRLLHRVEEGRIVTEAVWK